MSILETLFTLFLILLVLIGIGIAVFVIMCLLVGIVKVIRENQNDKKA